AHKEMRHEVHRVLAKVTADIDDRFQFNTAISAIMELVNALYAYKERDDAQPEVLREALDYLTRMLAPFAPHFAEELWHILGHDRSVHLESWPEVDPAAVRVDEVTLVVQV